MLHAVVADLAADRPRSAIEASGSDVIAQLALSDFLERGELDRHLRRMRARYAARATALLAALRERLPAAVTGDDRAGLHELVLLPASVDEPSVLAAAARRDVGLEGLSWHRHTAGGPAGLLVGYANQPEPALEHAVRLIAEAVAEVGA